MSSSSGRAANSATGGRAGPSNGLGSGVPGDAGAPGDVVPGGVVPGRVVISPRGATGPSGTVAAPGRCGPGVAAPGGGETSAVTVRFAHPATIAAGIRIETARAQTRRFFMIPPH